MNTLTHDIRQFKQNPKNYTSLAVKLISLVWCLTAYMTLMVIKSVCCTNEIKDCYSNLCNRPHTGHRLEKKKIKQISYSYQSSYKLDNVQSNLDARPRQKEQQILVTKKNFHEKIKLTIMWPNLEKKSRRYSFVIDFSRLPTNRVRVAL